MTQPSYDYDVFISYARNDGLSYAEQLEAELSQAGFKPWRDKRLLDPNQDFTAELERGIERSAQVVCCITPDTRRDDSFVRREIAYAIALGKPIIPLIFEDTLPPIHIINITRVDFTHQAWQPAIQQLRARLLRPRTEDETTQGLTPPEDPFRDYLNMLYKQIIAYLTQTVFELVPGQTMQELITLKTEATAEAVQPMPNTLEQALPLAFFDMAGLSNTPDFRDFAGAFAHYDGRILLLGEPGSGKTTTLMAFARDAVSRRLQDPSAPLPLLAPVATWDVKTRPVIAVWMASQIPALRDKLAEMERIITAGGALLLLDGMDELGIEDEDIQKESNTAPTPSSDAEHDEDPRIVFMQIIPPNNQVIVSCRVKDYNEIIAESGHRVALNGAVTLQPLDDAQMVKYLQDFPELWDILSTDNALRDVARTPLLLRLFTFAFAGLKDEIDDLHQLSQGGAAGDVRDHIFRIYVERRYHHEGRKLHADLKFSLDALYDGLCRVAMFDAGKWRWLSDANILPHSFFDHALPSANDIEPFIELALRLHILVRHGTGEDSKPTYRFIHLLLRDYFAYTGSINNLHDFDNYDRYGYTTPLRVLGILRDERVFDPIRAILQDKKHPAEIRQAAAETLGRLRDPRALQPLIDALDEDSNAIRRSAVDGLGWMRDPRAYEAIVPLLEDPDRHIRRRTVFALSRINDPRAIEPLKRLIQDEDHDVRNATLRVLRRLGAVDALITAMSDERVDVRYNSAIALGRLADASACPVLMAALRDKSGKVRGAAAISLGKIGDAEAIPALIQALISSGRAARESICKALLMLDAFTPLVDTLNGTDESRRVIAPLGLWCFGERAISPLTAVLNDKSAQLRFNTVEALGRIESAAVVPLLINALADENRRVRGSAAYALENRHHTAEAQAALADARERGVIP